jgi:hypothetical protein
MVEDEGHLVINQIKETSYSLINFIPGEILEVLASYEN